MEQDRTGWTTANEVAFIDYLGTGRHMKSNPRPNRDIPRDEVLRRYLKSCETRDDWGDLDKKEIVRHVKRSLGR